MEPQWTVLFFIYAEDDNTKFYADELIDILLNVKRSAGLRLLAFDSRYSDTDNSITGALFELRSGLSGQPREKVPILPFTNPNPGNKDILEEVLLFMKHNKYLENEDNFLLFTFDHGSGFGIFDADPRMFASMLPSLSPLSMKGKLLVDHQRSPVKRSRLRVVSNNRSFTVTSKTNIGLHELMPTVPVPKEKVRVTINMLTIAEINEALTVLGRPTQLMIMLNCWTQMLENSYELENTVEWLVAPETVHYFKGYDYLRILNSIADDPDIEPVQVAEIAISSLRPHFESDPEWKDELDRLVVSAVKPAKSRTVIKALRTIYLNGLKTALTDKYDNVKGVRAGCIDISKADLSAEVIPYKFIDLLNFIAQLEREQLVLDTDLAALKKAVSEYVQFSHPVFNTTGPFNGFSVFHPDDMWDFNEGVYYDSFYLNGGFKIAGTVWSQYLKDYRAGLESNP